MFLHSPDGVTGPGLFESIDTVMSSYRYPGGCNYRLHDQFDSADKFLFNFKTNHKYN